MANVVTYAEKVADRLTPASLELASGAASLADEVTVLLAGEPSPDDLAALGGHGAGTVVAVAVPPSSPTAPCVAAALAARLETTAVRAVLLPGTCDGRDVAAAVSVAADRPVLANVVGLRDEGGTLVTEHAIFGGTTRVAARATEAPALYLLRPGAFVTSPGRAVAPRLERAEGPSPGPVRVLERHEEAAAGPGLEDAAIVVTGGRGLGSAERFASIEALARLLGGAPGATRAIVDAGWAPYGLQVGQTGKMVRPDVYLSFGVSGATQHLVGMRSAKHVVAVNTDEHAPIVSLADLAVVGDAPSILDRLVDALRSRVER